MELFTDTASTIGFGGYFNGKWFQGRWPPHLVLSTDKGISIEWQELFPIVVTCAIWHPHFAEKRLQFWCDNESVVAIIYSGNSKAPCIMDLLRFLTLTAMKHKSGFHGRYREHVLPSKGKKSRLGFPSISMVP